MTLCKRCWYVRKAKQAAEKAKLWDGLPNLAGPWLLIKAEFDAMLYTHQICECGQKLEPDSI